MPCYHPMAELETEFRIILLHFHDWTGKLNSGFGFFKVNVDIFHIDISGLLGLKQIWQIYQRWNKCMLTNITQKAHLTSKLLKLLQGLIPVIKKIVCLPFPNQPKNWKSQGRLCFCFLVIKVPNINWNFVSQKCRNVHFKKYSECFQARLHWFWTEE